MPAAGFEALNERGARPAGRAVRQPAQRRGRQPAPEGPGDHRPAATCRSGLPARRGRGRAAASRRTTRRWSSSPRSASRSTRRSAVSTDRRRRRLLHALAGAPPRPRLRDRRRRRQGRRPRAARAARLHVARAALGDRLQVPARGAHDAAARHPGLDRPHRAGDAVRRARAGVRRRLDGRHGDAAQRGPGAGQGRAARRHRIVRKAGDVIPEVVGPVLSLRPQRHEPWAFPTICPCPLQSTLVRPRARPTPAASSRLPVPARPADHLLRARAARWTSRASASGPCSSSARPGSSRPGRHLLAHRRAAARARRASRGSAPRSCSPRSTASTDRPLPRLLTALGIQHLGPAASQALARTFGTLDGCSRPPTTERAGVDGVGGVIAGAIAAGSRSRQPRVHRQARGGRRGLRERRGAGGAAARAAIPRRSGQGGGRHRRVPGFSREEAEAAIKDRGGKSPGSVSKKTFALVVGEDRVPASSPRPSQLGVPGTCRAFEQLLETGELPA